MVMGRFKVFMRYIFMAILFVSTVACIKRDPIRYVSLPFKSVDQVELFPGPPDRPYKVVGHVFIDGLNKRGWQEIAEAAREEAAELGADAVFLPGPGKHDPRLHSVEADEERKARTTRFSKTAGQSRQRWLFGRLDLGPHSYGLTFPSLAFNLYPVIRSCYVLSYWVLAI